MYVIVHYEHQGTDLDKYPDAFNDNVCIVAYGVDEITHHVDLDVYDAHQAYEMDKMKMKMLVPLDINGQRILNFNPYIINAWNCYGVEVFLNVSVERELHNSSMHRFHNFKIKIDFKK